MVECRTCNESKPLSDFYPKCVRKCGTVGECAECTKKRVRDNRARRIDYYRKFDADRYQNDPRVRARHREYQATDAGRRSALKARRKWVKENPDKRAAHVAVGNAVRDGKIEKPSSCEKCNATGVRLEGHHPDYDKPLDVVWLCRACHVAEHREEEDA